MEPDASQTLVSKVKLFVRGREGVISGDLRPFLSATRYLIKANSSKKKRCTVRYSALIA